MICHACQHHNSAHAQRCSQCAALVRWRTWTVRRPLGAGGMGTAYLVEQGGQQAVLKLFHATTTHQERMLEARNLYTCAALGVTPAPIETTPEAVLMEYLAPTATVPTQQRIVTLLKHLNLLHNRGFVVVDLKPDNVIVTAAGTMLIDLGSLVDVLRDHPTEVAATPGYAARELYQAQVAPIADAYAAGWCIVQMLGGPDPDPGTFGPPAQWQPPASWEPMLRGLLEPDASQRLPTALAFHTLVRDRLPGADLVTVPEWRRVLPGAPCRDHHGYATELAERDVQHYLAATGQRLPTLAELQALAAGTERQASTRDWTAPLRTGLVSDHGARNCRRWLWQPTADAGLFGGTAYTDMDTMPPPPAPNAMIGLRGVR